MDLAYCLNNVDSDDKARLDRCCPDAEARLCLQRCGRCAETPFVVADGELRSAENYADLIAALPDRATIEVNSNE